MNLFKDNDKALKEQAERTAEEDRQRNKNRKKFQDVVDFAKTNSWLVIDNEFDEDNNQPISRTFLTNVGNIVCVEIDEEDGTSVSCLDTNTFT
jgi:hypothetical protein